MPRPLSPAHQLLHSGGCGCGGPLLAGLAALVPLPGELGRTPRPRRPVAVGTVVPLGATVLPVDAGFSEAEAIAIRDNRILAVGSEELVVLAEDPRQVAPERLAEIEVSETWMDGVRRH